MPTSINGPDHLSKRAAGARALAGVLTAERATLTLLEIARGYETLAQRAKGRAIADQGLKACSAAEIRPDSRCRVGSAGASS